MNGLETWISAAVAGVAFVGERRLGKKGSLLAAGIGFGSAFVLFSTASVVGVAVGGFFLMAIAVSFLEPLLGASPDMTFVISSC